MSMTVGNLDPLKKLIRIHSNDIENFVSFTKENKSSTRKWLELIYCILAGTQIKSTLVQEIYRKLLRHNLEDLRIRSLCYDESSMKRLEEALKSYGYRFPSSKTQTIRGVARLFKKYNFDVDNFLLECPSFREARSVLCRVKGVGYKIASHWLRNIGFDVPIVDLHVKNLLQNFGIASRKASYLEYENLLLKISRSLEVDCVTLDMALWLHGVEYCSPKRCGRCSVSENCLQSSIF